MRVLLVKPHPPLPLSKFLMDFFLHLEPLELEIVAGGIPAEDEVAIIDLSFEQDPFEGLRRKLVAMQPDIVGFTGFSSQAAVVRELAVLTKATLPAAVTVVGGIHATVVPADYAIPEMDIIVRGEGGTAFREISRRFKGGLPLHAGPAILSPRDPEFAALAKADPPPYPKIEEIPLPRRDLVDRSRYFVVWTASDEKRVPTIFPRTATIRTSYGCPFKCSFCVVHHVMRGQYLQRTPEDVVDEIAQLQEDHIYFVDDENFINNERMTRIAELLLARGIRKKFISWARSDTIVRHPELFALWKKAGLSMVYVGLEAMTGERLEKLNKRTTEATNRRAVEILRELGITLHASFMLDPDFDEDDFAALKKEVKKLGGAEITFTVFSPSPGTELWEQHKHNFIKDPYVYYDCMHTILPTRLPIRRFYQHFSDLYGIVFRANPLRRNKVKFPLRELVTVISRGFKYVFALRALYKEYEPEKP
ncbi:MAG: radical SAM protein [Deltaproteobacteria bacterium]|nr:MAG: radical SAM protein [Deltaproteobacteria bacterium]